MTHFLLAIIYIAFISLGLPDSLLGSAWPTIYTQFGVPVSYAGVVSTIICLGTIVSSLLSNRLTRKLGTGKVVVISVASTAIALMGFSVSSAFWMLCLWAVPYGLGAGSVDACLNNYVALHYKSRHMSWLHCFWGIGASIGPYIMGFVLTGGDSWNGGYRVIGFIQIALTAVLLTSLPMWKGKPGIASDSNVSAAKALTLKETIRIPGAKESMLCFFCYNAIETTAGLWASSYLALCKGVSAETAASFAGMFFIGITIGRAISGFATMRFSNTCMIRMGQAITAAGMIAVLLPLGTTASLAGLMIAGLGCAPIYPCIIHATPDHFGAENSQALIGIQTACAYCGSCLMPPVFGAISSRLSLSLYPVYLLILLAVMVIMHECLLVKAR